MTKDDIKNLHARLKHTSVFYWQAREWYVRSAIAYKRLFDRPVAHKKPRLLFYHLTGLGYGGTEAFLQIIAKHLPKDRYDVYFAYADQTVTASGIEDFTSRLAYILEGRVFPIRLEYDRVESQQPYFARGVSPNIFDLITDLSIDLVVTAGAGHAAFPFSAIQNIPIIFINIFGQPNCQKNIAYHVCISHEVAKKTAPIVPSEKVKVMYVPSELPLPGSPERGLELRRSLGIPDNHLVLGRIGRASDDIFDPIGIEAFARIVAKNPEVHYLIVSPPPALREIVATQKIPRVYFVPGSGRLEDLWSFYYAMDILAHFRKDGESFGLNIAQAMLCGRPVVSHRSPLWNAHLEYLADDFSRVAECGNTDEYARYLQWFIQEWRAGRLAVLGERARAVAQELVSIERHVRDFDEYIRTALGVKLKAI